MRSGNFNFAAAVIVSLAAHALLWPASKRILIPQDTSASHTRHATQITLLLNSGAADRPLKPAPTPKPKVPEIDSPEDMGEHAGKGTGSQAAKGDTPLKAPEADQDQAFLSRDPIGHGRVGDPPAFNTGRRGQNGHGGQAGAVEAGSGKAGAGRKTDAAPAPHSPPMSKDSPSAPARDASPADRALARDASHAPAPAIHSPPAIPPPSDAAKIGAAKLNLEKPAVSEVKPTAPLAEAPKVETGSLPTAPAEGPSVTPVESSGKAPPTPDAPKERPAIAMAIASPLPPAPVAAAPPAAATEAPTEKSKPMEPAPAKPPAPPSPVSPPVTPAAPAPALVSTGDSRAPGLDRPSADPAQESDSESDPFSKTAISAVLHDGRLEVREGRKIKTTRPHFLPGAVGAFLANPDPVLVLKISVNPNGNVKNVDIVRSTGSIEIDQPCRVAVYDWWFEPSHDKKGRPVADVVLFTIRIR
ncbi:MAG TPA: energy transducer TonB [Tepidisphaeraceae bacterium]|jgi:TonB family protein|nr:energy transducer TonB [Tepidisphaeraceae bacterium]